MGGVTAVPEANQAAPHPTPAPSVPYSILTGHSLFLLSTLDITEEGPCHILANPSEDSTQSTSLQYSHKTSLITERETHRQSNDSRLFIKMHWLVVG